MEIRPQIELKFNGVNFPIVNLTSELPRELDCDVPIGIDINPKVFYPKETPNVFMIIQDVRVSCEGHFEIFLVAVGNFEVNSGIDSEHKKSFVNVNAPAIMFPYIRSFITTLSANIGNVTGTLTLPPQFFKGDLEEIEDLPGQEN
jgi:preprotein translocase subunit SecB